MHIQTIQDLRSLYDQPSERAVKKEITSLDKHCRNFISKSPFFMLASSDGQGNMDNSPRGGEPGFVKVLDDKNIAFPDSRGNNRLDSLENILSTGHVGMLFFIPGIDETLRLNGKASIHTDTGLLELFPQEPNPPKVVIKVEVETAFMHCAKAFMRSKLWDPTSHIARDEFPTMGQILKDHIGGDQKVETQDQMLDRYKREL